ncbi:MAG: 3-keto-5-aminohexanoate cleavage protein [Rhodoblastus sp.]|nr:3-keto-5-aminohexanoate cleavage protein [Rhodoblastus sp.]
MMQKMIIEARINEYAMRDENPHVPWTVDEIADAAARCREAGASILHFHARADDGSPLQTFEKNAEIIRRVRAKCDMLILPTLGFFSNDDDTAGRIGCMLQLARDPETRPDIAPIDTGSTNLETFDAATGAFGHADRVYENSTDALIRYASGLREHGIKPKLVCWSIGFVRRAAALMAAGLVDEPGYFLLNMTDGRYITGHPGTPQGLQALVDFLPADRACVWTANIVGGSLVDLAPHVARLGGNIAPGIGDYAYSELGAPPNHEIIRRVVDTAQAQGREIATPDDVRKILKLPAAHV